MVKTFELKFASRDGNDQLHFEGKTVKAANKAEANRIGKSIECPADKLWFRSDLTKEVKGTSTMEQATA